MPFRLSQSSRRLVDAYLKALEGRALKQLDLGRALAEQGRDWGLPSNLTTAGFIAALVDEGLLVRAVLKSEKYRDLVRYTAGEPSAYALAVSIGQHAYLSHGTAVLLHGLTDELAKTIYVNDEQRPKSFPPGQLTQHGIDVAFSRQQRVSSNVYVAGNSRYLVVSGKGTGRLEVTEVQAPDGCRVDTTKLERTLIDIAVRPDYAGGPHAVRDAYAVGRDRVSGSVLAATLNELDYAYPYHQVIGFYMERAGYDARRLDVFKRMGISFRFYLSYGLRDPDFDESWQLFVPKGF